MVRVELFVISVLFLMAAFSFGGVFVIAQRLFKFSTPDFVKTIVNYVSGVKLYSQDSRYGTALFADDDFLDTMGEPPRVSIRRRMIEAIVKVAGQKYDRWYIMAHSLGSVIAFNGIMEPAETLAHYLNKDQWKKLQLMGLAGPFPHEPFYFKSDDVSEETTPRRKIWVDKDKVVYRHKLFENFCGIITYGSPLEKFAALWQARVPINNTEPHFSNSAEWINIYDPIDPVSGVLRAYNPPTLKRDWPLRPLNIGFDASKTLLYAHLRYLSLRTQRAGDLADAIAEWIFLGGQFRVPLERPRWFVPFERHHNIRSFLAGIEWAIITYILAFLGSSVVCLVGLSVTSIFPNNLKLLFDIDYSSLSELISP
jgi:hypothetical protein